GREPRRPAGGHRRGSRRGAGCRVMAVTDEILRHAQPVGSLRKGEVHVWRVAVEGVQQDGYAFACWLSEDERAREQRFHFERDRRRFRVTRGLLRVLLGRYLCQAADGVELAYGDRGKPRLRDETSGLRFNVSHSGGRALLAFARGRDLGVDLELMRPVPEMASLTEQCFSPAEREAWRGLPEAERPAAFFRCWTRKEAFVKATGDGLSRPLDSFDVSLGTREPA